jgi:phosphoribosylformylglycinamidine cyclo-ligase
VSGTEGSQSQVEQPNPGATYAAAGVDTAAGERAVALMRAAIASTHRPEVVGEVGGFAGLFDASRLARMRRPLLATSTDGVGTKVAIAAAMDRHDTIGEDLVAMVVDDLVVCGAEPLFLTDYIAVGRVVPERVAAIVTGIARGAARAGAALIGGETAEHPGLLGPDEYDIAGAGTGVVEADEILGPDRVRAGDILIALGSSGLHSNGYSLARHVLLTRAGWELDREVPELGRSLGAELLEPTRIYAQDILTIRDVLGSDLHAVAHITGGGIAANVARVLPEWAHGLIERSSWTPQPIFDLIGSLGGVSLGERERTFNEGIGMVLVADRAAVPTVLGVARSAQLPCWVCGEVRLRGSEDVSDAEPKGGRGGTVAVVGSHPTD